MGEPEPSNPNPIEAGIIKPIAQTSVTRGLLNSGVIGDLNPMTHHEIFEPNQGDEWPISTAMFFHANS